MTAKPASESGKRAGVFGVGRWTPKRQSLSAARKSAAERRDVDGGTLFRDQYAGAREDENRDTADRGSEKPGAPMGAFEIAKSFRKI